MGTYEILDEDGQTVINTITADADFMSVAYPHGGYRLIEPADGVAPTRPLRRLTRRAFWSRFPVSKEAVLRAVRLGAPAGALMLVGMLDRLNSRVDASPYVNLDDDQAIEGVRWLASDQAPETVSLDGQQYPLRLTQAEADAILLPDPIGAEVFGG